jgi:hypothetical protein
MGHSTRPENRDRRNLWTILCGPLGSARYAAGHLNLQQGAGIGTIWR